MITNKKHRKCCVQLSHLAGVYISIPFAAILLFSCNSRIDDSKFIPQTRKASHLKTWKAPDTTTIPHDKAGNQIRYGRELLAHTANYFGPNGTIAHLSNGMNCQNCHLEGGSRIFANNYSIVNATYPRHNNRSGKMQPITGRISDCFNRSLAGRAPDTNSREVQAMVAYLKWIGQGVKKGQKPFGTASEKLPFLKIAADPAKGKVVYMAKCKICHGINGEGLPAPDKKTYTYPPLWGPHSYNDGAGMYRLSNLAGFVKNNMPFGATYNAPQLTNQQAWDVAAFVNSQPRLHYDQHNDWKDLKTKPVDLPFGPYADGFSEAQHKYGPFKPILAAQAKNKKI